MSVFLARLTAWLDRTADSMERRPHRWLTAFAVLLVVQISPYWYVTSDSASYLSIARSMALGDTPANFGSRQLYFAPGYPLLIAPAFLFGPRPLWAVSLINALFALGLMGGVYVWFRRHLPPAAILLTGLVMLNASLWILYRRPLSELAFMAALVWMAVAIETALSRESWGRVVCLATAAGALASLLVSIRHAGAMCVAGCVFSVLWISWRGGASLARGLVVALFVALPPSVALVGVVSYERAQRQKDSYTDQVVDRESDLPSQILEGFRLRMCEVGTVLVPGTFKSYSQRGGSWLQPNVLLAVPVFAAVAWGWWLLVRRGLYPLVAVWPPYLALYLVWPHDQGNRFTVPMLPLLVASLWIFLEKWLAVATRRRLFVELLAAHAGVALIYWIGVDLPRARRDHAQWPVVERLAASASGSPVLAYDMPDNLRFMLSLQLDRRVESFEGQAVARDGAWVVAPFGDALAGYHQAASAGEWQLLAPTAGGPAVAGQRSPSLGR